MNAIVSSERQQPCQRGSVRQLVRIGCRTDVGRGCVALPLFAISDGKLSHVEPQEFALEKDLQSLVENNLGPVFNCRLVASEFSTGAQHGGRIDTLALSEDNNPVIIEYKKVESSELITQSLFYLSWLDDHRGDFGMAVLHSLGPGVEVDWSDIRVICIAPNFRRYDLHAVQVMGANIELWRYRLYANSTILFEEVFKGSEFDPRVGARTVRARTGAVSDATPEMEREEAPEYTFDHHMKGKSERAVHLATILHESILEIDPAIEMVPRKYYIAYRTTQNIVCMEIRDKRVVLYLKLDPATISPLPENGRDVSKIGHFGTGDLELRIDREDQIGASLELIELAYKKIGA